jgi:hypothetical protein
MVTDTVPKAFFAFPDFFSFPAMAPSPLATLSVEDLACKSIMIRYFYQKEGLPTPVRGSIMQSSYELYVCHIIKRKKGEFTLFLPYARVPQGEGENQISPKRVENVESCFHSQSMFSEGRINKSCTLRGVMGSPIF